MGAWVTWPERPKGAKDKFMMPEGQKAGPKGRQLEVGAQQAPRLLVFDISIKALTGLEMIMIWMMKWKF